MRRRDVAAIAGLLLFLGLAAATAPRWARLIGPAAVEPEPGPEPASAHPRPGPPVEAAKRINVKLYFPHTETPALAPEDREVAYSGDLSRQIRTVVEALIAGSTAGHQPALPAETRVLAVFVTARGTAYVDLSGEARAGVAGSTAERLAVYALVNSIAANLPAIRSVQLLVDDRALETLAGHLDLSRPLWPDMTLVAVEPPPLEPLPPADGEPPAEAGPPAPAPPAPSPSPSPSGGVTDQERTP